AVGRQRLFGLAFLVLLLHSQPPTNDSVTKPVTKRQMGYSLNFSRDYRTSVVIGSVPAAAGIFCYTSYQDALAAWTAAQYAD
ncbi:MAG: hypothetical protein WA924_16385, partial [Burkholderiaceae bacterium]